VFDLLAELAEMFTKSELETLRPGNVADDVTSGADTFADW